MTDSRGNRGAEPGWYADPAGSPRQRWWDGAKWTEHLHDPSLVPIAATVKPVFGPQTPVHNLAIWVITLLPILSVLSLAVWDIDAYLVYALSRALPPLLDPAYLSILLLSAYIYIFSAMVAFWDWRQLNQDGFVRPFHWAWTFLTTALYVIGRSVIVKRRTGRGLAPIWTWAVITIAALIVVAFKLASLIPILISIVKSTVPSYS